MADPTQPTPTPTPAPDPTCADALYETADAIDGVVRVEMDTKRGRLVLDYDRTQITPREAERLLSQMASAVTEPATSCTFHLGRQGGRSCETCALALEERICRLPGIQSANASFRSGVLRVEYDDAVTSPDDVAHVVRDLGVWATPSPVTPTSRKEKAEPEAPEPAADRATLWTEAAFVALALAGLIGGLAAEWTDAPPLAAWISYGISYAFGGWYGLRAGWESLRHGAVDIDLLMILAALGALSIGAPFEGAMLLFLFSLSNVLQQYAIGRSRRAIEALMELRPEEALIRRDGEEMTLPIDEVRVDDVFIVRPGDRIPLDGTVVAGESSVDQASLTGESVPVSKTPGSEVFGGTINESGSLEVRVTRRAQESAIARLIKMVEQAQSEKAQTQRLIDRLEQPYALGVLGLTALAIVIPLILIGESFDTAFYRAMTLMVAASPCAVVISTPAAVLSAIASGARRGILFKGGAYVESAATIKAVAFDKTGTLTEGNTHLTDLSVCPSAATGNGALTEEDLLALAAAVQGRSEHHLAQATVEAAKERGLTLPDASGFQATVGKGVRAMVDGATTHIGRPEYFDGAAFRDVTIDGWNAGLDAVRDLQEAGKTSVLVVRQTDTDATVLGWMAFADTLRPGAKAMVQRLRDLGVEQIVMISGDNQHVAEQIAAEAGIDAVYAELLPEKKVDIVRGLVRRYGKVAMVGDGVNDAPALAIATVGIAMGGAGTDVALETADIVLMADDLSKLPVALALSRATRRTLIANLAFAFGAIGVMVTAILTTGIPLPLAVVGHEGSTVLVSLNGLRLLAFRGD
jgi:Cd2+/Zn2+-exporting ATPase